MKGAATGPSDGKAPGACEAPGASVLLSPTPPLTHSPPGRGRQNRKEGSAQRSWALPSFRPEVDGVGGPYRRRL